MAWSGGEYDVFLYRAGTKSWQPVGRAISSPNDVIRIAMVSGFKAMYVGTRHRPSGQWLTYYVDASGGVSVYG